MVHSPRLAWGQPPSAVLGPQGPEFFLSFRKLSSFARPGRVRAPAPTRFVNLPQTAFPIMPRLPAPSDKHLLPERSRTPAAPARTTSETALKYRRSHRSRGTRASHLHSIVRR